MVPYFEQTLDLSREYSSYFAPYKHVADPHIDDADEGMTTASTQKLFEELKAQLVPIVPAICEQSAADVPHSGHVRTTFVAMHVRLVGSLMPQPASWGRGSRSSFALANYSASRGIRRSTNRQSPPRLGGKDPFPDQTCRRRVASSVVD
jgi:hypothetical protein